MIGKTVFFYLKIWLIFWLEKMSYFFISKYGLFFDWKKCLIFWFEEMSYFLIGQNALFLDLKKMAYFLIGKNVLFSRQQLKKLMYANSLKIKEDGRYLQDFFFISHPIHSCLTQVLYINCIFLSQLWKIDCNCLLSTFAIVIFRFLKEWAIALGSRSKRTNFAFGNIFSSVNLFIYLRVKGSLLHKTFAPRSCFAIRLRTKSLLTSSYKSGVIPESFILFEPRDSSHRDNMRGMMWVSGLKIKN